MQFHVGTDTDTLHFKFFFSDKRRQTVPSKLEKFFLLLNASVVTCLIGQGLAEEPVSVTIYDRNFAIN